MGVNAGDVLSVLSLIVAGLAVCYTHRQGRELARQTKISDHSLRVDGVALNLSVDGQFTQGMREIQNHFVEAPDLRKYFYAGVSCPSNDEAVTAKVESIAEMFGDILEVGLKISQQTMGRFEQEIRADYCQEMLETCPTLARLVCAHPRWWPSITAVRDRHL